MKNFESPGIFTSIIIASTIGALAIAPVSEAIAKESRNKSRTKLTAKKPRQINNKTTQLPNTTTSNPSSKNISTVPTRGLDCLINLTVAPAQITSNIGKKCQVKSEGPLSRSDGTPWVSLNHTSNEEGARIFIPSGTEGWLNPITQYPNGSYAANDSNMKLEEWAKDKYDQGLPARKEFQDGFLAFSLSAGKMIIYTTELTDDHKGFGASDSAMVVNPDRMLVITPSNLPPVVS